MATARGCPVGGFCMSEHGVCRPAYEHRCGMLYGFCNNDDTSCKHFVVMGEHSVCLNSGPCPGKDAIDGAGDTPACPNWSKNGRVGYFRQPETGDVESRLDRLNDAVKHISSGSSPQHAAYVAFAHRLGKKVVDLTAEDIAMYAAERDGERIDRAERAQMRDGRSHYARHAQGATDPVALHPYNITSSGAVVAHLYAMSGATMAFLSAPQQHQQTQVREPEDVDERKAPREWPVGAQRKPLDDF